MGIEIAYYSEKREGWQIVFDGYCSLSFMAEYLRMDKKDLMREFAEYGGKDEGYLRPVLYPTMYHAQCCINNVLIPKVVARRLMKAK